MIELISFDSSLSFMWINIICFLFIAFLYRPLFLVGPTKGELSQEYFVSGLGEIDPEVDNADRAWSDKEKSTKRKVRRPGRQAGRQAGRHEICASLATQYLAQGWAGNRCRVGHYNKFTRLEHTYSGHDVGA